MGWTNSHLHQFKIGGVVYGDPELLYEGWEDEKPPVNSLRTKVSTIIPEDGKRDGGHLRRLSLGAGKAEEVPDQAERASTGADTVADGPWKLRLATA